MKKYVWLNMETGKFSNSWTEEEHKRLLTDKEIKEWYEKNPQWKLIEYTCINEPSFELYERMKIVDKSHDNKPKQPK